MAPKNYMQIGYQLVPLDIANASSIVGNMIPVFSWYHCNTILTNFLQSGIMALLILAILRKAFLKIPSISKAIVPD
jgi:hypothetical protein